MRRLLVLPLIALAAHSYALTVGDAVPDLKVETYVKGKRVDLSKGIHVVEFWATWCHPCIDAMPHLTELAKKYKGKADFTGVSVWEHGDDQIGLVRKFVDSMGPKMGYNVAWDGTAGVMAKTWLAPAKQNGIPASFVIKDGKIMWIGHPMEGLDETVGQLIAGNFDLAASKASFEKASNEMERMMQQMMEMAKQMKPINDAIQAKDYATALSTLEAAETKSPLLKPQLEVHRYEILSLMNSPQLLDLANRFATEDYKDDAATLNAIAWKSIDPAGQVQTPNYPAALVLAKRAAEVNGQKSPRILNTYAYALFKTGDTKQAIELQSKAIDLATNNKATKPEDLKLMQDRLDTYKKG